MQEQAKSVVPSKQGHGQRSDVVVGIPGGHRALATLFRSRTSRRFRTLRPGLCGHRHRRRQPLHAPEVLGVAMSRLAALRHPVMTMATVSTMATCTSAGENRKAA